MGRWPIFLARFLALVKGRARGGERVRARPRGVGEAMRDELLALLQPVVAAAGCELVELECNAHRGGGLLRLYIDCPGAVTVEDCARVSRAVGAALDAADPIRGEYTLEVSSPGLDRPLRTAAHYARQLGARVRIETELPRAGRRRWTGRLAAADGGRIALEVDGQTVEFQLSEIRTARLAPDRAAGRE
jgi:ribosome maturation factor RimP